MAFPNALARQGSRTEITVVIPLDIEEKFQQEFLKGVGKLNWLPVPAFCRYHCGRFPIVTHESGGTLTNDEVLTQSEED